HGLISALAADPRPRYQDDPERVYGMTYGGRNVRFTVSDGTVHVIAVEG
ncbi:MAG: tRNA (N6-threonylcarbamoyladenosine(37)-N6)-methyltransferase TrmO, partial [Oscillospiraceae bacterium]|nr:tRNA (N6-threonylcarbamoyladenosine(37)-N6)-methyltransferase TrmO [Oscillospiraceae bacterium]